MSVPVKLWRIITVGAVLLSAVALVGVAYAFNDSRSEQERIRESQLDSCNQVSEPIIAAVEKLLEDQIEQTARIPASFFPGGVST